MLILIIISTLSIALVSFVGALVLFFKEDVLKKVVLFFVAMSAGSMIGGGFFSFTTRVYRNNGLK